MHPNAQGTGFGKSSGANRIASPGNPINLLIIGAMEDDEDNPEEQGERVPNPYWRPALIFCAAVIGLTILSCIIFMLLPKG